MARQVVRPKPYLKNMEAYNDFSGGLNTVTPSMSLRDNEFQDLVNADLAERGSSRRRKGMVAHIAAVGSGLAQGCFRYYKTDGTYDELTARGGKLYKGGSEVTITGLSSFQSTRQIEAVQFKDKLYIATGTKLVEYDGTTAKVVEAYRPEALEVLYIGTNALADNPDDFITDSISAFIQVTGITVDKRYGITNVTSVFTAYVAKPSGATVEYKWEWKRVGEENWVVWKDFTADQKTFPFWVGTGDYEIRCTARVQGNTDVAEYHVPRYSVKELDENKQENVASIQTCNRILVHWQRIILYGDPTNKDMMYVSDLDRPSYFPSLHTLRFENARQELLTALVPFRDMLVAFSPNSIQALFGKSPEDYSRLLLSSSIGCIAPFSAKVMENYVAFLSQEGVYILKTLGYTENRANVQKIDNNINNIVPRHTDACAIVVDGQYQITFPQEKKRLRFYYNQNVWTKDESDVFDFGQNYEWNGIGYAQRANGLVLRYDSSVMTDDGFVYEDKYVFKDYDFSEPYSVKKLKELQLLIANYGQNTKLAISVSIDGAPILKTDTSYASVDENGNAVWIDVDAPNLELPSTTVFGSWILGQSPFGEVESRLSKIRLSGKGLRVRLTIAHEEAKENHILGVGFIFKSKGV